MVNLSLNVLVEKVLKSVLTPTPQRSLSAKCKSKTSGSQRGIWDQGSGACKGVPDQESRPRDETRPQVELREPQDLGSRAVGSGSAVF